MAIVLTHGELAVHRDTWAVREESSAATTWMLPFLKKEVSIKIHNSHAHCSISYHLLIPSSNIGLPHEVHPVAHAGLWWLCNNYLHWYHSLGWPKIRHGLATSLYLHWELGYGIRVGKRVNYLIQTNQVLNCGSAMF